MIRGIRGTGHPFALLGVLLILGPAILGEESPPVKPLARPKAPGGIVAIVNDDVLTQADLDKAVRRQRAMLERMNSPALIEREMLRIQHMTLDRLIENKLVLQLARKEEQKDGKSFVTDADVDQEIKEELKGYQDQGLPISTTEELFRFWRERDGVDDREELRRFIKDQLAVRFYLQRHVFTTHPFVSPQELRAYYLKHVKEFTTPVAVSFYQIKVPKTHPEAEVIVLEIEKGLTARVDFCELAKKYDQDALQGDPESACRRWTKTFDELKNWHKPIPDYLQKMKKDDISPRIVSAVGIHFLKVVEVIEGASKPFSEVQEDITRRIRMERNQEQMNQFFEKLRKRSRVEIYLPPLPPPQVLSLPQSLPAKPPPRGPSPETQQAPPPEDGAGER